MIKIPNTAKRLLKRTIDVLEKKYRRNCQIDESIESVKRGYLLKQAIDSLKTLFADLNFQKTSTFDSDNHFEVMTRFVTQIMQWHEKFITEEDLKEEFQSIKVEKQLISALKQTQQNPEISQEADQLLDFITSSPSTVLAGEANFEWRVFKLIKDLNSFKERHISFLPTDFKHIQVFYRAKTFYSLIQEKALVKEWNQLATFQSSNSTNLRWIFKIWHELHETGYYYIYIP